VETLHVWVAGRDHRQHGEAEVLAFVGWLTSRGPGTSDAIRTATACQMRERTALRVPLVRRSPRSARCIAARASSLHESWAGCDRLIAANVCPPAEGQFLGESRQEAETQVNGLAPAGFGQAAQ